MMYSKKGKFFRKIRQLKFWSFEIQNLCNHSIQLFNREIQCWVVGKMRDDEKVLFWNEIFVLNFETENIEEQLHRKFLSDL